MESGILKIRLEEALVTFNDKVLDTPMRLCLWYGGE